MTAHDRYIDKARKAVESTPNKVFAIAALRRVTDLTFFEASTFVDAVTSTTGLTIAES